MSTVLNNLIKKNLLTQEALGAAKKNMPIEKKPIQDLLIEMGHLNEEDLFETAKRVFPRPVVDLDHVPIDADLLKLIPGGMAIAYGIFPVLKDSDILALAMSDPSDIIARDEIRFKTDLTIKPLLCKKSQIGAYIENYYKAPATVHTILKDTLDETQVDLLREGRLTDEEVVDLAKLQTDNSSVVKLINKIICDAVEARASDVHVEPQEKDVEVRYRIDGSLKRIIRIPRDLHPRLAARLKILSRLDIAEQRRVQEGRIKVLIGERKIDLRVSVIPIFHGEKIVLRILDNDSAQFDLNKLGFEPDELELFKNEIRKPQGVVLVTGPTGSGKTTTLYGALQHIKSETKNIVTIEDPIEYLIEGINQLQLDRFKDVTFATSLKSILRQDPDVMLVGEIRDRETAEIAFRASLTGHMVFSTLHTNSAASSITRLMDLGLESYLISSSINLIVAQRLVRLICPNCLEEYEPEEELLTKFQGLLEETRVKKFYRGKGCDHCGLSGFYGRTSIFEVLRVDEKIKNLIFNKKSEVMIFNEAVSHGMRTLAKAGILKVAAGLTTINEVAQVADLPRANKKTEPVISFSEWKKHSLNTRWNGRNPVPAF